MSVRRLRSLVEDPKLETVFGWSGSGFWEVECRARIFLSFLSADLLEMLFVLERRWDLSLAILLLPLESL